MNKTTAEILNKYEMYFSHFWAIGSAAVRVGSDDLTGRDRLQATTRPITRMYRSQGERRHIFMLVQDYILQVRTRQRNIVNKTYIGLLFKKTNKS